MWHDRSISMSFYSDNLQLFWKNCENKSFTSYKGTKGRHHISLESVFNDKTYYLAVSQRKIEDVPKLIPRKKKGRSCQRCTQTKNTEAWQEHRAPGCLFIRNPRIWLQSTISNPFIKTNTTKVNFLTARENIC